MTTLFHCIAMAFLLNTAPEIKPEHRFMWNKANSMMQEAAAPDDFLRAAETYGAMADMGVANGFVFYNMGTAFLKAGRYDEAKRAFLRAERHVGTTPEIRRNLLLATVAGNMDAHTALPWQRFPFFWHYLIPAQARLTLAVAAFAGLWIIMILRVLAPALRTRGAASVLAAVCIVFGASAATSMVEEAGDSRLAWSALAEEDSTSPSDGRHEEDAE